MAYSNSNVPIEWSLQPQSTLAPVVAHGDTPRWVVEGVILSTKLPSSPLEVLECTIRQLDGPVQVPIEFGAQARLVHVPDATSIGEYQTSPSQMKLRAFHSIRTTVVHSHQDAALTEARRRFARAAAAISLATDEARPAIIEVVKLRLETELDAWQFIGPSINIGAMAVGPLDSATEQKLQSIQDVGSTDTAFLDVLKLWYEASDYERHSFTGVDDEHVLVRYGKVLEAISANLASQATMEPADDETKALLAEISSVLAGRKAVSNQANAIIEIGRKLAAIQLRTIGSQVRAACALLSLDDIQTSVVMSAWSARSQEGGHPGAEGVRVADLNNAREAALTMLVAYVNSKT